MISKMCIMSPSAVAFPRGEQSPHKPVCFIDFTALSRYRTVLRGYVSRIYAPLRTCVVAVRGDLDTRRELRTGKGIGPGSRPEIGAISHIVFTIIREQIPRSREVQSVTGQLSRLHGEYGQPAISRSTNTSNLVKAALAFGSRAETPL